MSTTAAPSIKSFQILISPQNPGHRSISFGYGNAHIVFRLTSDDTLRDLIEILSRYPFENPAEFLEVGTFGELPVTLYLNKDAISFIVDGKECGDGSGESFGIYLNPNDRDELVNLLRAEHRDGSLQTPSKE